MSIDRSALAKLQRWLPLLVFVVALGVRLLGIGWGLKNDLHNQSYHPDEGDIFMYSQAIEPAHLKFTPGFYNYGTLYLSVLKVASDMTAAYTGGPDPKNADATWSFRARCNLAGRIISAFAGAGTVLVVFLILRRLSSLIGASAGAAILCFAPAHVVHSRFQTVDVTAVFLLALSVMMAFRFVPLEGEDPPADKTALRWIVLAGVFAGLSGGTKYTGVLGVLTILVVLFAYRRQTIVRDGLVALASTAVAFVVATPGVLLDNSRFMHDFSYEIQHTSTGHGLVFEGTANGFLYHVFNLFQGYGTIVTLLAIGALVYAAYRRKVWAIALLAFMIPYYFLIGRAEAKFMRYTFPLYIGMAVGFGWAVAEGQQRKGWGRAVVAAGICAIGGIDFGGMMGTEKYTAYMLGEDPRDSAARYLHEQAKTKPGAVVGLPEDPWFWSAPLFPDSTASRAVPLKARNAEMAAATDPRVTYWMTPEGQPTQFDTHLLTDIKPDFVTYSSLEYVDPERLHGRTDVSGEGKALSAQYDAFTTELTKDFEPATGFGDQVMTVQDMEYVQPHVVIWKRKATP